MNLKKSFLMDFKAVAGIFAACAAINSIASDDLNTGKLQSSQAANSTKAAHTGGYKSVNEWLVRIHEASRKRAYTGTFVVSVGSEMASARIWHVCDGEQQMERVESLTGAPRSTFRRNNQVVTFFPDAKLARSEERESLGIFPNFLKANDSAIAEFYNIKMLDAERVAGFDAEVVQLVAKDNLRYSYRIWTERKSGLVVKLQTLDSNGGVIEQTAFSELNLDAPVKMDKLAAMMNNTAGHKLERLEMSKTTAISQGWTMARGVPGFVAVSCFKRTEAMQWIFSDGLAAVSLFVEPFDRKRHTQEGAWAMGATQTLTKRMDDWWLTAVGEVPAPTLRVFAQQLERKK
jgi:sigma-E factor negative regulatory protein RseB